MSVPYSEGFLEDIIAVHWRGGTPVGKFAFFALKMRVNNVSDPASQLKVDVSFPNPGGTPGITLFDGRLVVADFFPAPHPIDDGDLTAPQFMSGGLLTHGFGVKAFEDAFSQDSNNCMVWFRVSDSFAQGTITLNVHHKAISTGGTGAPTPYEVLTWGKGVLKAGQPLDKFTNLPQPITDSGLSTVPGTNIDATLVFKINAKTLKVTAPPNPPA